MPLKHWQAWDINCLPRKPVPGSDQPHAEEMFPNAQFEPTMVQLCAVAMQGEEPSTSLSTSLPQEVVENCACRVFLAEFIFKIQL